jgi:hypothetical protein
MTEEELTGAKEAEEKTRFEARLKKAEEEYKLENGGKGV